MTAMDVVSWLDQPHDYLDCDTFGWSLVSGVLYLHRDPHEYTRRVAGWLWSDIEASGNITYQDKKWGTIFREHSPPPNVEWEAWRIRVKEVKRVLLAYLQEHPPQNT